MKKVIPIIFIIFVFAFFIGTFKIVNHFHQYVNIPATLKINNRPCVIVYIYNGYYKSYNIRYADDLGIIHDLSVREDELEISRE